MIKLGLEFMDVICEVMCAGEDQRDIFVIKGENVEVVEADKLIDELYYKEDQFVSCVADGSRLNIEMKNNKFNIDII